METEIWKTLELDDNCEVSNFGNFRRGGIVFVPYINNHGYRIVAIKKKQYKLHRLVAEAFITNSESKQCVDHKDSNRTNNNISNLRWATKQENARNVLYGNKSKLPRGVKRSGKKYMATSSSMSKKIYLGTFETIEEASNVYESYIKDLHGEFYCPIPCPPSAPA